MMSTFSQEVKKETCQRIPVIMQIMKDYTLVIVFSVMLVNYVKKVSLLLGGHLQTSLVEESSFHLKPFEYKAVSH